MINERENGERKPSFQSHRLPNAQVMCRVRTGQCDVLDLHVRERVLVGREALERLAVQSVARADAQLRELVENVQLREAERVVAVDLMRVLHNGQIEPSTSALGVEKNCNNLQNSRTRTLPIKISQISAS